LGHVSESKERLDKLIQKSRAFLYKPIAIAEILHKHRLYGDIDLMNKEDYRRHSYNWMKVVVKELHNKTPNLNSRYWDQLFDKEILPPEHLAVLGHINKEQNGIVEEYIYGNVQQKVFGLHEIINRLIEIRKPQDFKLKEFLSEFEKDKKYSRSVDKAYEVIVYALFNAVTSAMSAEVTLRIKENSKEILKDFEDFAELVLGLNSSIDSITLPARLYRVGATYVNDAGLDMWANFGPAVQVKHLTLSPEQVGEICDSVRADKVIIVCKSSEIKIIEVILQQLDFKEKLRGIITEKDLDKWCYISCNKYSDTVGKSLITSIIKEMQLEFPITNYEKIEKFLKRRNYDLSRLKGTWKVKN